MKPKCDRPTHDRISDLVDDIETLLTQVREQAHQLEEKGQDDANGS